MQTLKNCKALIIEEKEKNQKISQMILQNTLIEPQYFETEEELGAILGDCKKRGLESKEVFIIRDFKGRHFQECPGSKNMICCNYLLINTCFNCFYNCTYCFLNSYLNSYGVTQFSQLSGVIDEIKELNESTNIIKRIGTGEYTDSLMMDEETGIGLSLIDATSSFKNIILEFKTKSSNVDHLLDVKNKGNAVLAWSLNTDKNINDYEEGTASLENRLIAAKKAFDAGYFLAFHFDPIILYDGAMEEYLEIILKLEPFASQTLWVSMGGVRFIPSFKNILREHFPFERFSAHEMLPGLDGKMRYLKKERINFYKKFFMNLKAVLPKSFIYMCMESSDVWSEVTGVVYENSDELEVDMSNHLEKKFF